MSNGSEQQAYLTAQHDRHLAALLEFLRIASISTSSDSRAEITRAAEWVAERMREAGIPTVQVMETSGNPVIYGEWIVDKSRPTALIYGHYDVQPPEPLDLWETPAFEPDVREGKIYARGASDMKANLFATIRAIEAFKETSGAPPINVKFSFEGEEEVGSPNLPAFIEQNRDLLACDFVICADGGMWAPDTPNLVTASKGLGGCQINVRTAERDMHSGMYGAFVYNAVQVAIQLAASMHDAEGRIAIEGFYDDVRPLTDQDRAEFEAVPVDQEARLADVGASGFFGDPDYTPLERAWGRPTLDFNGFWGGYEGPGVKTVTPSEAHFKITCRLVADQDPDAIIALIRKHVETHCPDGAQVTVEPLAGKAHPFQIRRDHPALLAAEELLGDLFDRDPYVIRSGATVPVTATYQQLLGADSIFLAWSMPDEGAHAPNEFYRLSSFEMMPRAYCQYLEKLAEVEVS